MILSSSNKVIPKNIIENQFYSRADKKDAKIK